MRLPTTVWKITTRQFQYRKSILGEGYNLILWKYGALIRTSYLNLQEMFERHSLLLVAFNLKKAFFVVLRMIDLY